ncbi:MAG: adenylyl-sulfate kinase [Nitrospina sp.]|nr:adenylyl-sulfate kinase [Nitrospina sp.]
MNEPVWHRATVTRDHREKQNGHRSILIWFTGLSSSGKSTLSHAVEEALHNIGCRTTVLDGDNIRHGLSKELGFSEEDREENIRRIGEVAKLFVEAGLITMTAFISPFQKSRDYARSLFAPDDFVEIYVSCPIYVCEERDKKGVYKRAHQGEILDFTGISSPYEPPKNPDLTIHTDQKTIDESVKVILQFLAKRNICPKLQSDCM